MSGSEDHERGRGRLAESIVATLDWLAGLPRGRRRLFAMVIDAVLCILSVWIAFSLRTGQWELFALPVLAVAAVAVPAWFLAAWWCEIYRSIIRSTGSRTMADLGMACLLASIPMIAVFMLAGMEDVPRTIALLQPIIFLVLLVISRLAIRHALVDVLQISTRDSVLRVLIYGAGRAGQQLASGLGLEGHVAVMGFVDDDPRLTGQRIDGLTIHAPEALAGIVDRLDIDEVLLAIPSAPRTQRMGIVESLQESGVRVRSLPSVGNIIDGKVSVSDLRDVQIEELLGRDAVPPDEDLLCGAIAGKVVLVSGAGGSIGSELCRQILARRPQRLILVEQSEYALYTIDAELRAVAGLDAVGAPVELVPELADVADAGMVRRVMRRWRPDTVFHAAAYKHVPLVEANPIAGLRNNVVGTLNCCQEAEAAGVSRFILVSTDKAVRPTNVMGASKRICELILQARAAEAVDTVFAMVRFGNVLGSSGSVVPRFREQIAAGGPITLTHREVTRYFMTIPEASQLVMQAGAMARGGEVFVLDMGDPVRIIDLARTMVQLSGLTVRDDENPEGDIVIEEVGLRPGEKMYEELLIGENPEPTEHAGIMRARETMLAWSELSAQLVELKQILARGDGNAALAIMRFLVPEYRSSDDSAGAGVVDLAAARKTVMNSSPAMEPAPSAKNA